MITVDALVTAALESDNFTMAHLVDIPGGLYFTDWPSDIIYGGNTYVSNGKLLSLSSIVREGGIKTHSHTMKLSAVELGILAAKEAMKRAGIDPSVVDMTIFGHGRQAANGTNSGRQVSVRSGVPVESPAMTLNMACASGLKSIELGAQAIAGIPIRVSRNSKYMIGVESILGPLRA